MLKIWNAAFWKPLPTDLEPFADGAAAVSPERVGQHPPGSRDGGADRVPGGLLGGPDGGCGPGLRAGRGRGRAAAWSRPATSKRCSGRRPMSQPQTARQLGSRAMFAGNLLLALVLGGHDAVTSTCSTCSSASSSATRALPAAARHRRIELLRASSWLWCASSASTSWRSSAPTCASLATWPRPPPAPRPGIVAVPLDARTDVEITLLANLITMTPGSLGRRCGRRPQRHLRALDVRGGPRRAAAGPSRRTSSGASWSCCDDGRHHGVPDTVIELALLALAVALVLTFVRLVRGPSLMDRVRGARAHRQPGRRHRGACTPSAPTIRRSSTWPSPSRWWPSSARSRSRATPNVRERP